MNKKISIAYLFTGKKIGVDEKIFLKLAKKKNKAEFKELVQVLEATRGRPCG